MSTANLAREHLAEWDDGVLPEGRREGSEQGFVSTILTYMSRQIDASNANATSIVIDDDASAEGDVRTITDTMVADTTLNLPEDVLASGALAVTSAILSVLASNNPMEARAFCIRSGAAHREYGGATLLSFSAQRGNTAAVQVLLDARASVEARHRDWTAMMYAAGHGHAATAAALVAAGADVSARTTEGVNALMHAAARGHVEAIGVLLGAKADVDARDARGCTALMTAAAHGRVAAVTRLLSARAAVGERNRAGNCALVLAAQRGFADVVAALVCAGACGPARSGMGACAGAQGGVGACGGMRNGAGRNALGWAAAGGHVQCVRVLLAAGAEVGMDESGCSALMLAVLRRGETQEGEGDQRQEERQEERQGGRGAVRARGGRSVAGGEEGHGQDGRGSIRTGENRLSRREVMDRERGASGGEAELGGERDGNEGERVARDREEGGHEDERAEVDGAMLPVIGGVSTVRDNRAWEGGESGRAQRELDRNGGDAVHDGGRVGRTEGRGGSSTVRLGGEEINEGPSRARIEAEGDVGKRESQEVWAACVRLLLEAAVREGTKMHVSRGGSVSDTVCVAATMDTVTGGQGDGNVKAANMAMGLVERDGVHVRGEDAATRSGLAYGGGGVADVINSDGSPGSAGGVAGVCDNMEERQVPMVTVGDVYGAGLRTNDTDVSKSWVDDVATDTGATIHSNGTHVDMGTDDMAIDDTGTGLMPTGTAATDMAICGDVASPHIATTPVGAGQAEAQEGGWETMDGCNRYADEPRKRKRGLWDLE